MSIDESRWAPGAPDDSDAERTLVFDVDPHTADAERTQVLPVGMPPAPSPPSPPAGVTRVGPAHVMGPPPTASGAEAPADPRGSLAWQLEAARGANRPATDVGLLLLRVLSLPLVLHGLAHVQGYFALVEQLRAQPLTAAAPEVLAVAVIAGQVLFPVMLAVGFGTRVAALAQAALLGGLHALALLGGQPVLDPATGVLSGEAVLAYAALALPLVFTGPGRLSLDHAITASGRERRLEKKVAKRHGR